MLNEALNRTSWPPNWKLGFLVLLRVALLVLQAQVTLSTLKNSVNSVGTLRVRSGKESFGFKKLLELVWTLVYTSFNDRWSSFTPLQTSQSQNRWTKLNYFRFVCKEIALNELSLLFFAHYFSRLSRATTISCSLMTNGKPVYATAWKDLESCPCTKFCPACDKQVIASAPVQLRINFTCIFKVFQIALVSSRLGQFCENFENTREINP